jgi:predicted flap endonuclease-1-like 5' DNA nuclease
MNFWTGLILGIIIGWLIEWIIDWLFWRRDAEDAYQQDMQRSTAVVDTNTLQVEWEERLAAAQQEHEANLRAVEDDWQLRLDTNEQQWAAKFQALEADNRELRAQLAALTAGAALATAGARDTGAVNETDDLSAFDQMIIEEEAGEEVDFDLDQPNEPWSADQMSIEASDLNRIEGMDEEMVERLNLAGIDSVEALAAADPETLSVSLGLEHAETETWIRRAAAIPLAATLLERRDVAETTSVLPYDDLTHIKGIGPRYANALAEGGIHTYDDLATATPDQLRAIIKPSVMQRIDFDSWILQATALAQWRGVEVGDDLTELEGIGPTYAAKLRERGITTFAALAATDETTLAEIIGAPAWRRVNYADWIAQAQLAAIGDKLALQNLQERLYARTGDNLNLIAGLGNRSAEALQAAGITTYAALAATAPQDLEAIIRDAGIRGHFDYEAWINEAGLRAAGRRIPSTKHVRTSHIVSCPQDLSAVPGIGAIFEERLYAAGIGSYWELAETSRDELLNILGPDSVHGVDFERIKGEAMKLAVQSHSVGRSWDGTPPDDFDVLPEIGEIYERRLYEAGICTYEALSAATVEQLTAICKAPSMRTPDYAAWIATAAELVAARRSG